MHHNSRNDFLNKYFYFLFLKFLSTSIYELKLFKYIRKNINYLDIQFPFDAKLIYIIFI